MADLSHDSADEAFHEIQLSGKQLVFLFMATTVISVVIFLCGVLVGRGVRAEDLGMDPAVAAATEPAATATAAAPPPTTDVPTPQTESSPQPEQPQLTYSDRLDAPKAMDEKLGTKSDPPKPAGESPKAAAATPPPPTPEPASPPARASESPKPGAWAVQVVSLRDRSAASQLVQRLRGKSYPAFLVSPSGGAPTQLYKVQVGRYGDRAEAERIAARLKKEEQFQPFIVR